MLLTQKRVEPDSGGSSKELRARADGVDAGRGALAERAERVAQVAAAHAAAVDAGRFPQECGAALKAERLLGIFVPKSLGGEGASLGEVADVCFLLGQACSSSGHPGMIHLFYGLGALTPYADMAFGLMGADVRALLAR
jgi:alkylation response protein AidB-like acyl-CoA dehydrogenase